MTKFLRYNGEFLSRQNVCWKVELWQEAAAAFPIAPDLIFPADSPLILEWGHTDKEEPLCGSTATLRVISPGDRTFEDLYTIRAGSVQMRVFRNGAFYWSGTLDPEFYEEPYSQGSNYDVELTFSDFGILDRIPYTLSGIRTLGELMEHSLNKAGLFYGKIDQSMVSTSLLPNAPHMTLADLAIHSENFYDEDGKPSTMKEVLEAFLQPLALRMVQKAGNIYIYDLNGLYTKGTPLAVEWTSDDQMMGTDKVVNNAVVTFSPYAQAESMDNALKYEGVYKEDMTNLGYPSPSAEPEYYTYYPDYDPQWDYKNLSFTIFLSKKGSGLKEIHPSAKYFRIQPLLGGQESEGIAWMLYTGGHGDLNSNRPKRIGMNPKLPLPQAEILLRTERTAIQKLESADRKHYLRINMEMLLDMRYNPFSQKGEYNEGSNYDLADYRFNFVQIPFIATLYNEQGMAIYHYDNSEIYKRTDLPGVLNYRTEGKWLSGAGDIASSRLVWYSNEDRHTKTGTAGWQSNRHNIGLSQQESYRSFKELEAGQYLPYPPEGGYLEIVVYAGVRIYEWTNKVTYGIKLAPDDWYNRIRWLLFKAPTVNVVNANITHSATESDDIEYSGVINEDAKEPIELDTICGTSAEAIPSARGILLKSADHTQVKVLTRAGRTTQAEQLLIGTLYSQFADRKTLLSGTAQLLSGGVNYYTERMQTGKRMICLGDCQDVIADESEIEIVEFRPDEYQDIKT